ncbi:MAG: DUF885 domain-containing protein, partial [Paraglaciecola sp.]
MIRKTLGVITFLLITACEQPASESTTVPQVTLTESERLNQWFDEKYEERILMSPMTLTSLGRKERYDEFDDFSEAAEDKQLAWQAQTVAELKNSFNYNALTED